MRAHRSNWMRGAAVLFSVALLASACGGDDDGGGDTGTEGDSTAAATGGGGEGGGDLLAQLQESGSITIGIANEVPYGYQEDDGTVTGEAPEVAKVVLAEMGIDEVEAQVVEFGSLISGLQAAQFDMIAAGMYINAERAEQILFSDPDYCIGESLAVPEGNPLGLSDFQSVVDTPEATIAILSGAVEEGYAATAGVPDNQIELYTDVNAQYDDLVNGRVDAVTGTSLTVKTQVDSRGGLEMTESFFPLDEDGEEILGCGGFGFRNDNQDFRDAFNDQLNALQDEGALIDVITQFGFAAEDVERAQELTVADLTGEAEATGSEGATEMESETE